ncbi:hypothetical protein GRH90_25765 [Enterobacteriales bacterium SAP-6]|uniref:Uncharacterized protein n=1 Tax=Acerihabitans arboris TaxID=2691583 RepID=A0A845ST71_9GAMM|nr:hypothetical protein [Acerihabitans arboris]
MPCPCRQLAATKRCSRVLMLDEIGYLPMTREEASLFFRLLFMHGNLRKCFETNIELQHSINLKCMQAYRVTRKLLIAYKQLRRAMLTRHA